MTDRPKCSRKGCNNLAEVKTQGPPVRYRRLCNTCRRNPETRAMVPPRPPGRPRNTGEKPTRPRVISKPRTSSPSRVYAAVILRQGRTSITIPAAVVTAVMKGKKPTGLTANEIGAIREQATTQ